jgi:HNH endonuclease
MPGRPRYSYIDSSGYEKIRGLGTFEHVRIAEKKYGRAKKRYELVHHIDGDSTNNNPANLVICTRSEHARLHQALRLQQLHDEAARRGIA